MSLRSRSAGLFALAMLVALGWAAYTQHAWEDYYITYRASKNLATGHGLTFTVGERVHSFTSPLGVLLPALASWLTGNRSDVAALWIFRLMGAAALAGSVLILRAAGRRGALAGSAAGLLVAWLLTDAKILDFTVNGMETPFLLLFLAWTLWVLFTQPVRLEWHLGCAWAGLMWTRPDAFVYIGGLVLGTFLFRPAASFRERLRWLPGFFRAGLVTAVLYLPWLLWATAYYGTPVPHTITAKGLFLPKISATVVLDWFRTFPGKVMADHSLFAGTFMPAYSFNTGWPSVAIAASFWLSLFAMGLWLVPRLRWEARIASLGAAVGQFYLQACVGFPIPWYLPPIALLAFVALAITWGQVWTATTGKRPWRALLAGVAGVMTLGFATLAVGAAYQLRWQQKLIEDGERRGIGEWLRSQAASPRDTVMLEPLGYIGFYSNLKMLDYPGLGSPEMVAARRRADSHSYPFCWSELIMDLQPDWLVLRPFEADTIRARDPEVLEHFYGPPKVFDVRAQVGAIPFVPGRGYLLNDACFEVYHRKPDLPAGVGLRWVHASSLTRRESWGQPAYDSGEKLLAPAPSTLEFTKPTGARWLSGGFGFLPDAYTHPPKATDGAVFRISYISARGIRRLLLEREMDPAGVPGDRGMQRFKVELPENAPGRIELRISPGPVNNNAFDWTYWTELMLQTPRES